MSQRSWVLPDEPVPVRFMNTVWADRAGTHDDLATPLDLAAWLGSVGTANAPVSAGESDLVQARRLRDALRRVAALSTADTRVAAASPIDDIEAAMETINMAAALVPAARLMLRHGRPWRETASPRLSAALLSAVAVEAIELFTDPDGPPLRACQAPGCVLYFVGSHPNREWCSTACGNRARAARHYRKHRQIPRPRDAADHEGT